MIVVDADAVAYIKKRAASIVIGSKLEPAMGG